MRMKRNPLSDLGKILHDGSYPLRYYLQNLVTIG